MDINFYFILFFIILSSICYNLLYCFGSMVNNSDNKTYLIENRSKKMSNNNRQYVVELKSYVF